MTAKPSRNPDRLERELSRMSLADHIEELRSRLIKALIGLALAAAVCLYFGEPILDFIRRPLTRALADYDYPADLKYLNPIEYFSTYVRVGLICGLVLASPWVFYQIWAFVAAGLYKRERKWVRLFAPASLGLFIAGLLCLYFAVLPLTLRFLIRFGQGMATPWFTWGFYVAMVLKLALGFGIGFQTPLIVIFLAVTRLASLSQLCRVRKYVILGMLVLAAILTPPDLQSQILLALPMLALFELGLLVSWLILRKRSTAREHD
ncbi:MAG: twin-arginine translocase subunit TatC [Phycisphaerae bacterium]|nr:twin-arginine translocase subunit TatC [Phycisphaerae bacterium]